MEEGLPVHGMGIQQRQQCTTDGRGVARSWSEALRGGFGTLAEDWRKVELGMVTSPTPDTIDTGLRGQHRDTDPIIVVAKAVAWRGHH